MEDFDVLIEMPWKDLNTSKIILSPGQVLSREQYKSISTEVIAEQDFSSLGQLIPQRYEY